LHVNEVLIEREREIHNFKKQQVVNNKATRSLGAGVSAQNNYKLIVKTLNASVM